MAIIRKSDLKKMNRTEMEAKIKEIKMELIKANATSQKTNAKHGELKRTIARLLTFLNMSNSTKFNKEVLKN